VAFTNPSVTDFKSFFVRDFPYSNTDLTTVQDVDVSNALIEMSVNINPGLFANQQAYTLGALNLGAHYLVTNLRNSSQGISGQFNWLESSKGVSSVSEGFSIPQRILDNPLLAMLTKTTYGAKYLAQVLPMLGGAMFTTFADANPDGSGGPLSNSSPFGTVQ
jgi:hypothetical protein